jgi:MFS family permease
LSSQLPVIYSSYFIAYTILSPVLGLFADLFFTIAGIGCAACWAMYAACASDFFSRQSAGKLIGLWTFLLGAGSISPPILTGWAADLSSLQPED